MDVGVRVTRKRLVLLVVALAVITAGGVAYAAIPDSSGVIHGCYTSGGGGSGNNNGNNNNNGGSSGTLRVVDSAGQCKGNETAISWNQKGQKGDPGLPGTNGTNGKDGANGANGTNGSNGISPTVTQLGVGDPNCPQGGAAITDAAGHVAHVCSGQNGTNGRDGQPFSGTFTSPTGQFSLSVSDGGVQIVGPGTSINLDSSGGVTIKGGHLETVANDETITIGGNRTAKVGGSDALTVGASRSETIGQDQSIMVGRSRTESVSKDESITIGGNRTETVSKDQSITIGVNRTEVVGSNETITVQGNRSEKVSGSVGLEASATLNIKGAFIGINGGATCRPVARIGDSVDPSLFVILTGSPTVCIG